MTSSSESEPEVIYVKKPKKKPAKKPKKVVEYVSSSSEEDYFEPDGTSQYYSQFYY